LAFGVLSGHAFAKAPAYPVISKSAFFYAFFCGVTGDMVAHVAVGYLAATQLYISGGAISYGKRCVAALAIGYYYWRR